MSNRPSEDQRDAATFAALSMVLLVSISLLALIALVLPDVLKLLLVALGVGLFILMQYLVWGRWLTRALRDQQIADKAFAESGSPKESDRDD